MKTATLNIRVNPEVKSNAEKLYESFGITLTDAVNMFLVKSIAENGLPFELKQERYNAETEAAMQEAKDIVAGKVEPAFRGSFKELRKHLGV